MSEHSTKYLTGPAVMRRYGVTSMTIHRWQKNEDLGFPKAIKIGQRKFFSEEELLAWERSRVVERATQ